MSLANSPSVPAFDPQSEPSSVGPRWDKWVKRFEKYTPAVNITADARLKALMLHLAGERVHDIYDTLTEDDVDKYDDKKRRLTEFFSPKKKLEAEL